MKRQRGISLVSLLVGMVISLVTTIGLLQIYHQSLKVTTGSVSSNINDSQLASILLRTGDAVADAGYGITTPTFGTHIVALTGASLSGSTLSGTVAAAGVAANAVVWATLTGAQIQCAGFLVPASGGLIYLTPANCTNAAAYGAVAWSSTTVNTTTSASTTFTLTQQSCQPYGITNTSGAYTVTLATTNSISTPVTSVQCLINFQ